MPMSPRLSPFARPRWTVDDARVALSALERSGQSVSAFAAEHGLDPQRLYQWRRRLGKAEPTTFREVVVRPAASVMAEAPSARFEVALPSGEVLRVPVTFESADLIRLLEVLARARAC
jgi:transposase-like protein